MGSREEDKEELRRGFPSLSHDRGKPIRYEIEFYDDAISPAIVHMECDGRTSQMRWVDASSGTHYEDELVKGWRNVEQRSKSQLRKAREQEDRRNEGTFVHDRGGRRRGKR
ncbi:hypothetical protein HOI83_00510 [Candidatus Uhrbacteria bacterium]|jgi:hypothetical protein|nr:hypothetical protein [Candidatus Uhrbacteria bacterium]